MAGVVLVAVGSAPLGTVMPVFACILGLLTHQTNIQHQAYKNSSVEVLRYILTVDPSPANMAWPDLAMPIES